MNNYGNNPTSNHTPIIAPLQTRLVSTPSLAYLKGTVFFHNRHNSEPMTNVKRPSIDALTTLLSSDMKQVNQVILDRMGSDVPMIPQLANHLIAAGGKRMRPMLCLAGALAHLGAQDKADERALILAAAVEFIHNATLLHDDVIDESDKRRGRDTANALWGNEASVLVGDFLFARAFELMVETDDIAVLGMLSSASARITEGEVKQMTMAGKPNSPLQDYLDVITGKTAILFAAAIASGAKVVGAGQELVDALHEYGLALGMAFQIVDDALDYRSELAAMGKNSGDDFNDGKITMPVILAWQAGTPEERAFWQRTIGEGEIAAGDFEAAVALLDKYQAIDKALEAAKSYAETAAQSLGSIKDDALRGALTDAAYYTVARTL